MVTKYDDDVNGANHREGADHLRCAHCGASRSETTALVQPHGTPILICATCVRTAYRTLYQHQLAPVIETEEHHIRMHEQAKQWAGIVKGAQKGLRRVQVERNRLVKEVQSLRLLLEPKHVATAELKHMVRGHAPVPDDEEPLS